MIRERVSTQGSIRPLEPEDELPACTLPHELIGVISELAVRRYQDGLMRFGKKFAKTTKSIAKERRRNLDRARKDTVKNMSQLQTYLAKDSKEGTTNSDPQKDTVKGVKEGLATTGSWSWAWALDCDEVPPPSSIVSRRDTEEARRLAKIADQAVLMEEDMISGNNLWSLLVNFLTVAPDKHNHLEDAESESKTKRLRSRISRFM